MASRLKAQAAHRRQGGFTLIETLVTLALVTTISLIVVGALAPWMGLKQSIDNDRKLQDLKQGLYAWYEANAMAIESGAAGTFGPFRSSELGAGGQCDTQEEAFVAVSSWMSESAQQMMKDGFSNNWCVLVADPQAVVRDGATLWYRSVAFVSTGRNGALDASEEEGGPSTGFNANGNLVTVGDDVGIVVSGYDTQYGKLKETLRRMTRMASVYETFFTMRYLENAQRDITVYYFSNPTHGAFPASDGWMAANDPAVIALLGLSPADASSAWELENAIEIGNTSESDPATGLRVRSTPGELPYTALLRARLPAPLGEPVPYLTQVAVGNY